MAQILSGLVGSPSLGLILHENTANRAQGKRCGFARSTLSCGGHVRHRGLEHGATNATCRPSAEGSKMARINGVYKVRKSFRLIQGGRRRDNKENKLYRLDICCCDSGTDGQPVSDQVDTFIKAGIDVVNALDTEHENNAEAESDISLGGIIIPEGGGAVIPPPFRLPGVDADELAVSLREGLGEPLDTEVAAVDVTKPLVPSGGEAAARLLVSDVAEIAYESNRKEDGTGSKVGKTNLEIIESPEKGREETASKGSQDKTVLEQLQTIVGFVGPSFGIWLANPIMSIIDTAVVGRQSTLELAALGPGTMLCDQISYLFMFLSVATSNLIATSLAQKNEQEAADHLGRLLFVAFTAGIGLIIFIRLYSQPLLLWFVKENVQLVPAARTYALIRGWAWPAVLVMAVAQSASLGMQDAWGPLKVLGVASMINFTGDMLLCSVWSYGIAGAAWATMASQWVGCVLMLWTLHRRGSIPLSIKIPAVSDLLHFIHLAGPILLVMLAKTTFYGILTYVATSLGPIALGAHQVAIGIFALCAVCGEPLSQTAQSFLPDLTVGVNKNLKQAGTLLKSLLILGLGIGFTVGSIAGAWPWVAPTTFTKDPAIIAQWRELTLPLHASLLLTPIVLSLEGTLLAGRDVVFLALNMLGSLAFCILLIVIGQRRGMGIVANWWTLVVFQLVRMVNAGLRLRSSKSILADNMSTSAQLA
eukprot:jgi/Mesen1/1130/ME000123S00295